MLNEKYDMGGCPTQNAFFEPSEFPHGFCKVLHIMSIFEKI